jgi:hypothetical protein
MATKIIGKNDYILFQYNGRQLDDRGLYVSEFSDPINLKDSIQAVPRNLYAEFGLDWNKYYIQIYTDNPLMVVERENSGDQIEFNGSRYQLLDNNDWNPIDGWQGVLAVRLDDEVSP